MGGLASLCAKPKSSIPDSLQVLHFEVNGVPFDMQRVEGGVFVMGGTREQHRERISTDLPTHTVALDAYYIASTEVTQALWKAVMPEWEFIEELYLPNFPISYISWNDCQEFVRRLDSITGMPFRLPTEAEWQELFTYAESQSQWLDKCGSVAQALSSATTFNDYYLESNISDFSSHPMDYVGYHNGFQNYVAAPEYGAANYWTATLPVPNEPQAVYENPYENIYDSCARVAIIDLGNINDTRIENKYLGCGFLVRCVKD